ncbi:Acylphosphatase-1 [Balamuthia mandrillaris]
MQSFEFEVFGKVQGVFFRKHTVQKATELGLVGWVMNTKRGTVVGHAQGEPPALGQFRKWLQEEGSPKSVIEKAQFTNEQMDLLRLDFTSFQVRKEKKKSNKE